MSFRQHAQEWVRRALRSDRVRHAAVGVVCAFVVMGVKFLAHDGEPGAPSYVLLATAIGTATWFAGPHAGAAALAASVVGIQLLESRAPTGSPVPATSTFVFFVIEGLLAVAFVALIRNWRTDTAERLRDSDAEIARLRNREQDLSLVADAFETFSATVPDHACVMLDVQGRVVGWNAGAERFYGYEAAAVISKTWPALGSPDLAADEDIRQLLPASMDHGSAVGTGWLRRADGRRFRVEVAVAPLRDASGFHDGFVVATRDLTSEQASEAFRTQAIATEDALRGEADALTDQLEAIQSVLDPALSDLPAAALVHELLVRLRTTLRVDGVAFVDTRDLARPIVMLSSRDLQPLPKPRPRPVPRRLRIIQNDDDRAREASALAWPEPIALMVTVPLVREKHSIGVLEVVTRSARRWSERDAILLLLAADRVGSVLSGGVLKTVEVA